MEEDRDFLFRQQVGQGHKNLCWRPEDDSITGYIREGPEQETRLRELLRSFAHAAEAWLGNQFPGYAAHWRPDRASFRPEEEATRRSRRTARNDLLHIDSFPSRPSNGWRILRLFVNLHRTDARVWATSDTFDVLLARFGRKVGLPGGGSGLTRLLGDGLLRLFQPTGRSEYDRFMLRLHHFLKNDDGYQDRASRRLWTLPPGSCWLAFTDFIAYADLRGRYALERTFFIPPEALLRPELSPVRLLERACGMPVAPHAA